MSEKKFEHILFIGTGGGSDIFSVQLAITNLRRIGWQWDAHSIAGVLNPGCIHEPLGEIGYENIKEMGPECEKKVPGKNGNRKVNFIDPILKRFLDAIDVYSLLLEKGSNGLVRDLKRFAEEKGIDYIVLVDIGGDILFGGEPDRGVLSPLYDATVLAAFKQSGLPGILFEAGLGTDGELLPERLAVHVARYAEEAYRLSDVSGFYNLFERIIAPHRKGNTVPNIWRGFSESKARLSFQVPIKSFNGVHYVEREFLSHFCKMFYLIDPKRINNPFAIRTDSFYEVIGQTQKHVRTNVESDFWLRTFRDADGEEKILRFVTPSPLLPEDLRRESFQHFLNGNDKESDMLVLHDVDLWTLTEYDEDYTLLEEDEFRESGIYPHLLFLENK